MRRSRGAASLHIGPVKPQFPVGGRRTSVEQLGEKWPFAVIFVRHTTAPIASQPEEFLLPGKEKEGRLKRLGNYPSLDQAWS